MTKKIIVIGAGISGISSAEFLRREGLDVTIIDPVSPGDPKQTSYGNAGLLAVSSIIPVNSPDLWYDLPAYIFKKNSPLSIRWQYFLKLMPWLIPFLMNSSQNKFLKTVNFLHELTHDSVDQHFLLAQGTKAKNFIKTGDLAFLFKNENEFKNNLYQMKLREKHGFSYRIANRSELIEKDPQLSPNYNYASIFSNQGWISSPGKYIREISNHFSLNGGKIIKDEVVDIHDSFVMTKKGIKFYFDKTIVCTGVWSKKILKKINHYVNLESERGYHLFLKNVNYMPSIPYIVNDQKFAVTPMEDGLRFAGTTEFGGIDAPASEKMIKYLRNGIKKIYPTLKWDKEEFWMGHRPTLSDSLPVIGKSELMNNVYFGFGGQHVGITIGPKIGRIISDLVVGRKTNILLSPYNHNRF